MNKRNEMRFRLGLWAAFALVAMLAPTSLQAQDTRALPFEGCWTPGSGAGTAPELCIRQSREGLVLTRSGAGMDAVEEQLPFAQPREVTQEDCSGLQTARFSEDAARVLLRTEFTCSGGVQRVETGILALPDYRELLDVRTVQVGDETIAWVQYYELDETRQPVGVSPLTWEVARRSVARAIDVDDVPDALRTVDPKGVEAWLAESASPFEGLDASRLLALSDAGVPTSVLDVMIAVTHPERFALAVQDYQPVIQEIEASRSDADWKRAQARAWGGRRSAFSPWGWGYNPWSFGYNPWGYNPWVWGSFGFNSGFGFNRWGPGFGDWGWGGWGGGVVVVPAGVGGTRSGGKVVNGRGYRSGRSLAPESGSSPGASSSLPTRALQDEGRASTRRLARPRARTTEPSTSRGTDRSRQARPATPRSGGSSAGPPPARSGGSNGGAARSGGSSTRGGSSRGSARPRRGGGGL
jgi:hypothetical protein